MNARAVYDRHRNGNHQSTSNAGVNMFSKRVLMLNWFESSSDVNNFMSENMKKSLLVAAGGHPCALALSG